MRAGLGEHPGSLLHCGERPVLPGAREDGGDGSGQERPDLLRKTGLGEAFRGHEKDPAQAEALHFLGYPKGTVDAEEHRPVPLIVELAIEPRHTPFSPLHSTTLCGLRSCSRIIQQKA